MLVVKLCECCGIEMQRKAGCTDYIWSVKRVCGDACLARLKTRLHNAGIAKDECSVCGKPYVRRRLQKHGCCGKKCLNASRPRRANKKSCPVCGAEFFSPPTATRRFCSKACRDVGGMSGVKHGMSYSRLHSVWCNMKRRCNNPNNPAFRYYGGAGVTVCREWSDSFAVFQDWAESNGYSDSLEIDRKNPAGNYEPDNCRWVNHSQQVRNRRKLSTTATSRFKGVYWCANLAKWRVQVCCDGRWYSGGGFVSETDAAKKYDEMAIGMFGEYACLNFERSQSFS